jgi:transcriptional regulator with XRE-family HTH domain
MAWINLGAVLHNEGLSMRKFADEVGMKPSDVTKLFKEGRDIKVSTLLYWSECLNVPVEKFFDKSLSREDMTMPRPKNAEAIYQAMKEDGTIKKLKDLNKKKQKGKK